MTETREASKQWQEMQEKWSQEQIGNILDERERRGYPWVDEASVEAAVRLLNQIRVNNSALDLFYKNKMRLRINENNEVQLIPETSDGPTEDDYVPNHEQGSAGPTVIDCGTIESEPVEVR